MTEGTREEAVEQIFAELRHYVPAAHIDGQYGLLWMLKNDIINEEYLQDLLMVRRVQFLEGRVSPESPVIEYQEEGAA